MGKPWEPLDRIGEGNRKGGQAGLLRCRVAGAGQQGRPVAQRRELANQPPCNLLDAPAVAFVEVRDGEKVQRGQFTSGRDERSSRDG